MPQRTPSHPRLASIATIALAGWLTLLLVHPPTTLADSTATDAWHTLFDGTDTAQWRGFRKDAFPEQGWSIEEGWLRVHAGGGGGDIITKGAYSSFDLRFEWKCAPGANSGVMFGVDESQGAPWLTGPEYQILDDGEAHSSSDTSAGALYALVPPRGKTLRPAGEVNHGRIVVAGDRIDHYLNGVLVASTMWGSDDWRTRVEKSKFASMPTFGTVRRGHIALQDHGNDVWFRNIEIRRLPAREIELAKGERIRLLDGKDFANWTFHLAEEDARLEDTWSLRDGVLVCTGSPAGYLKTKKTFTNFHLVVEWRWDPVTKKAGNSGVLLRQVGEDRVWPKCVEAQLMSGRAGDFYNIGEFPMRGAPDRTNGRHTAHLRANEHPVGQWNRYDITVRGDRVELRVNGELLNTATEVWETAGHIGLQSEGTEIHFRTVDLYPLAAPEGTEL